MWHTRASVSEIFVCDISTIVALSTFPAAVESGVVPGGSVIIWVNGLWLLLMSLLVLLLAMVYVPTYTKPTHFGFCGRKSVKCRVYRSVLPQKHERTATKKHKTENRAKAPVYDLPLLISIGKHNTRFYAVLLGPSSPPQKPLATAIPAIQASNGLVRRRQQSTSISRKGIFRHWILRSSAISPGYRSWWWCRRTLGNPVLWCPTPTTDPSPTSHY